MIKAKAAPAASPLYSHLCQAGVAKRALDLPFAFETIRLYDPNLSWSVPLQTLTSESRELISAYVQSDHTFYWVIAAGGCQSEPIPWHVKVTPLPPTPLIEGEPALCAGDSLKLKAAPWGGQYATIWTLPSGEKREGEELIIPSFEPSDNGLYQAAFISAEGCASLAASVWVAVKPRLPLPKPAFYNYFKENIAFCPHNEVNFFIANYPEFPEGAQFEWRGPNGFYSLGHPQPGLPAPRSSADNGVYKVRAFMDGCFTEWALTDSLVIHPKPAAPQIIGPNRVCLNGQEEITLAVAAPIEQPYYWLGPGNFLATTTSITRPARRENLGVYSIVTQNSAGCFSDTALFEVSGFQESFRVVSYSASLCQGQTWRIRLEASAALTYHLSGPGWDTVFTSSQINLPYATVAHSGVYTLTAQHNGCVLAPQYLPLQVKAAPDAPTILGESAFCSSQTPFFEVLSSSNAALVGTKWYLNGSLQGEGEKLLLPSGLSSGLYILEARHYQGECVSLAQQHVFEVLTPPPAPQIRGERVLCYGDTLRWEAVSSVAGASYLWRGPGNFYTTGKYLERVLPEAGVYTLEVIINGCAAYTSAYLEVRPLREPPVLARASFELCLGADFRVTATLPGASSFLWRYPNQADWQALGATLRLPAVSQGQGGVYSVRALVEGCLTAPASFTLVVSNLPPPILTSNQNSFCANERAHLRELSGLGEKYLWSGPGGFYRETASADLIFIAHSALSGVYSVQYIRNGCTSAVATLEITVRSLPSAPIIRHNRPECVGRELRLEALPILAGARYFWQGPNFSAEGSAVTRQLSQKQMEGVYSVAAIEQNCTSAAASVLILLQETPSPPQVAGVSQVCEGKTAHWRVQPGEGYEYRWQGPGGFTAQGSEISFTAHLGASGIYSVTAQSGACVSLPSVISLQVYSPPVIQALESNAPLCVGSTLRLTALSPGAGRYFWLGPSAFLR
jgi:hypothetical protein